MSRRTGVSGSRKSQREEDRYDEMEPEEMQAELEMAIDWLDQKENEFKAAHKKAYPPTRAAHQVTQGTTQALEEFENEIKAARNKVIMLLILIMNKIEPYEKLPKDHQYYLHHEQKNKWKQMDFIGREQNNYQKDRYEKAGTRLAEEAKMRDKAMRNRKLVEYV